MSGSYINKVIIPIMDKQLDIRFNPTVYNFLDLENIPDIDRDTPGYLSRFINTGYGQCIYINGKLKGETNTWYKHLKIFNRKIEQYLGIVKIQLESEDTGEKGRQLTLAEYINLLKCTNDDYKHHGREIFTIYSSNKVNQQIIIDEDAIGIFVSDVRGMNNES